MKPSVEFEIRACSSSQTHWTSCLKPYRLHLFWQFCDAVKRYVIYLESSQITLNLLNNEGLESLLQVAKNKLNDERSRFLRSLGKDVCILIYLDSNNNKINVYYANCDKNQAAIYSYYPAFL